MVFHRILDFTTRLDFYPASIFYFQAQKIDFQIFPEPHIYLPKPSSLIVFVLDYFYDSKK